MSPGRLSLYELSMRLYVEQSHMTCTVDMHVCVDLILKTAVEKITHEPWTGYRSL